VSTISRVPAGSRARSARTASRNGSYCSTIPGPPPYGRSSTVRCRSVVKSRGDTCSSAINPRSRARPTTPTLVTGTTSSGNNATTPIRYIRGLSELGRPVRDDHACGEIDAVNHRPVHERDQPLRAPREHEHVVSAGRNEMIDRAEPIARGRHHLEPFEVGPVILARPALGQRRALDHDVRPDQLAGGLAIVDSAQLRDHARALRASVLDLDRALAVPRPDRPTLEADDVVTRLGVGVNLDPPAHAVNAADAAKRNESIGGLRAHCVIAERARRAQLGRGGGPFVLLQKIGDAFRLLGALAHPVLDAARVDAKFFLA